VSAHPDTFAETLREARDEDTVIIRRWRCSDCGALIPKQPEDRWTAEQQRCAGRGGLVEAAPLRRPR
jgi:hypothetical protein